MSQVSKASSNRSTQTRTTRSAPPPPASRSVRQTSRQAAPAQRQGQVDRATVTREKGKAGPVPDFSQSFGARPATLRNGSSGDNVKQLQEMLNARGAKLEVDGKFGGKTAEAVRKFQEENKLKVDGIAGAETFGKLQPSDQANPQNPATPAEQPAPGTPPKAPEAAPQKPADAAPEKPAQVGEGGPLKLPDGYGALENLSGQLAKLDPRFDTKSPEGRSATALALAIGGTEAFGKGKTNTDFFTHRGGTGNNMQGFAQFNRKYHASKIDSPEKYTKFLGNILHGEARMPNSKSQSNHVKALTEAVSSGKIKTGDDLRKFMTQNRFGGSNWQGIDDGWGRNPGLADALVKFLRQ